MALTGLKTMFINPSGYNILPFKNYDTDDGKPEITAFFLPAHKFALTSEYLDNRGVTDHIRFKKFYEAQRAKLSDKELQDLVNSGAKKYVRYEEGAVLYSMGKNSFRQVAQDAHAIVRLKRIALVNVEVLDEYLESFRE